jgi:hypothetical protein
MSTFVRLGMCFVSLAYRIAPWIARQEAGISKKFARSVGIAVDYRRTNLSVRHARASPASWLSNTVFPI